MKIIVVGHILEHVSIAREWLIGLIQPTTYSWSDLYTGAKKTRPTGQTGDYFAKIAQSSQKAAPLICLRSRGSGASHNHLRSSLTQERSYHHENREKECQLSFDKDRRKGWEEGECWMESATSVALWQGRKFFCSFLHIVHNLPVRVFLPPRRFVIHCDQNSRYEWGQRNNAIYSKRKMKNKKIALITCVFEKNANLKIN